MDRRQFGTSVLRQLRSAFRRTPAQQPAPPPVPAPPPAPQPGIEPQPVVTTQPVSAADAAGPLERSRVVFGNELAPGAVVLEWCSGKYCRTGSTHRRGSFHELTILRLRGRSFITAVTIDEDGNQQPFEVGGSNPVRVRFE